ncbi:geranylgeranyl reductase family protein [Streptomyces sp. NBC_01497]|uniref:geranylgeranyl reductase family protein n=1 Tax=Streptomyces sp. NBC_01497 TaxID=2903885 RepID=UPI002E352A7E|nr:geranylgeranyl reductase family protein [Streptomyces sp. NBC_01497]
MRVVTSDSSSPGDRGASAVDTEADVIVVGAGPAGSSAAYHLAASGVDVLVLEKSHFPREKVCGDGLTPRAVRQLIRMGIDIDQPGWMRSRGMRWMTGERRIQIDWPDLGRYPSFGLSRSRHDFDDLLARHAVAAGARLLTGMKATGPVTDRGGRVTGVTAVNDKGESAVHRAPIVIAADGASARLALAMGLERDNKRQIATAARRYYRSPTKSPGDYLELWADVRLPRSEQYLPGYGWIFPMGDGRVNVGLGSVAHRRYGRPDLKTTLDQWLARTPDSWGLREGNAEGPLRSAALPMGFNRHPLYARGVLLVGDSGGMVSPWNGEGIGQALEAGEVAAETVALALARPAGPGRERVLRLYPAEMNRRWGRYYRLGNLTLDVLLSRSGFHSVLNHRVMDFPFVSHTLARLLANLTDEPSRDAIDHLVNGMVRLVPTPSVRRR